MKQASPLFSILVAVEKNRHLLPLTLDTLKAQSEKNFEVLLLAKEGLEKVDELRKQYPDLDIEIVGDPRKSFPSLMNEALQRSKGKYLQFLEAGDRFLSQQGISSLEELIKENRGAHLIYSGFLMKEEDLPSRAIFYPLSLENLQKARLPSEPNASWFSRDLVLEMGGFDEKISFCFALDLFCRIFQKPDVKTAFSRRIFTESEPKNLSFKEATRNILETYRILYRHFGLYRALKWLLLQDSLQRAKRSFRFFKHVFLKGK